MKILIDECLPRRLANAFEEYTVSTVPQMGWAGKKNGELLGLMHESFDVFITIDSNLTYQQYLKDIAIIIVLLSAPNNKLESLLPLVSEIKAALKKAFPGTVIKISSST